MKRQSVSAFWLWTAMGTATAVSATAAMLMMAGKAPADQDRNSAGAKTILLLDGYVQSRFEEDNNRFGMDRMPPPVSGHGTIRYQLAANNPAESQLLKEINDLGWEYTVEFVHCTHPSGRKSDPPMPLESPAKVRGMTLVALKTSAGPSAPFDFSQSRVAFRKSTEEPIQKRASAEIAKLMKGASVDATIGTWRVAYRPVRASKASCLRCHAGASGGDVLGVMAYAVRQPVKAAPDPAPKTVTLR